MDTFGRRMAALRKERKMTQQELSKLLKTSMSVVGRYERDEMTPSIEVAKNIASLLTTTVGYLLGETDEADLFKDPAMLKRLSDLEKLDEENKSHILSVLDGFLQSVKFKNIAAL
ncbi:MAG: helix-turn-helix domain-containing protein [Saprospiraceae bacterium]|nr:helix-turn-helix domain-containing protein [Saprospiraceae bacterium]